MKKALLTFTFICLLCTASVAQKNSQPVNRGFTFAMESRYMHAFYISGKNYIFSWDEVSSEFALDWRALAGYYIFPRIAVSAGVAFQAYTGAGFITPFVDAKAYLKDARRTPFCYADAGYSIAAINDYIAANNSWMFEAGVGYRFSLSKVVALTASLGYNYKQKTDAIQVVAPFVIDDIYGIYVWNEPANRHSIVVSIGLAFR